MGADVESVARVNATLSMMMKNTMLLLLVGDGNLFGLGWERDRENEYSLGGNWKRLGAPNRLTIHHHYYADCTVKWKKMVFRFKIMVDGPRGSKKIRVKSMSMMIHCPMLLL